MEKICATLARHGFEVEVVARRAPGEAERSVAGEGEGAFAIHRVGSDSASPALRALSLPIPGNPVWSRAIRRRIREWQPALVIARDIPLALPVAGACRAHGIPWVIDMAEHYPIAMRTWRKYQANPSLRFLINTMGVVDWVERQSVLQATGILPVIEEQKERLVRQYGYDPARIQPVLNTPERRRLPERIEGKRKGAHFGYHGVVIQDRDLVTVLRGFEIAASRNSEMTLTIAGMGESLRDLQALVAGFRHRDRIDLTGKRFKPEEVRELYSAVDFGIVSWTVNEFTNNTIGNKFFDYPAFGKPIIYTETDPMVRLMRTMKCGVGYRGGDPECCAEAMLRLLDSDYEQLARNGREAVEREFNWDIDTEKMVGFLHECMDRRGVVVS